MFCKFKCLVLAVSLFAFASLAVAGDYLTYKGGDGPGKGKKIVLISGDEEYRSEEALPMLGKILSQRRPPCAIEHRC